MNDDIYSTEEWVLDNEAEELKENIEAHIGALTELSLDDADSLSRLIMISIRQYLQMKELRDEE